MSAPIPALFLSASLGGGHLRAGEALARALSPQVRAEHRDYLAYLNPAQRGISAGVYLLWLRHSPASYRYFYHWSNRPQEPAFVTAPFSWAGAAGLRRDLRALRPRLVVSSYTAPAALAGALRERGEGDFLNVMVVTDYSAHKHWARPEADLVLVASDMVRAQLISRGLDPARVAVTGIPIDPQHGDLAALDRAGRLALRERLGFSPELPLVLVSAGGQGHYRSFGRVLDALAAMPTRVQVLALAGSGRGGGEVEERGSARIAHLGYRGDFAELLAASDLVVGKAGGLTVAETTALGVPMVVFDPIPGQEEGNADELRRAGAGVWTRSEHDLAHELSRLLLDPEARAHMSAAAARMGRPHAAQAAASLILRTLEARQ